MCKLQFSQEFSTIEKWTEIWTATFGYLGQPEAADLRLNCLSIIRILSRDKTHIEEVVTEQNIRILLQMANIDPTGVIAPGSPDMEDLVVVESLKCLCNLVFNSSTCQHLFEVLNGVDGIMQRIRSYK